MPTTNKVSGKNRKGKNVGETALSEVDKALETAFFYGFTPIKHPGLKREDISKAKDFDKEICSPDTREELKKCHNIEEKICLLRNFTENSFRDRVLPGMFCYRTSRKLSQQSFLNLAVLGPLNSVAEIIAIKTALAILSEKGRDNLEVEINSIGDRESFSKFEKDFNYYLKKNLDLMPQSLKQTVAASGDYKEVFKYQDDELLSDFWTGAPKPINYLTTDSINHFKEILEYLENFEVPYNINHLLIPNKEYCHQTTFRIKNGDLEFALGIQHCNLARKIGIRKDISILTVAVKDDLPQKKSSLKKIKPKFYLIQFGAKAKMKSLFIIELLRKAGLPVYHSLTRDKLQGQLASAEKLRLSHILIIGEKEALEDSVIVRNMETRFQEVVPFARLVSYLKKIKA